MQASYRPISILAVSALLAAGAAFAQSQSQSNSQQQPNSPPAAQPDGQAGKININEIPPPPADAAPTKAKPASNPAATFDPLGAEKDLEVGNFYFKKGNYDAAIERYQDATVKHAGYAKPFLLLGEAYEKKDDPVNALKAYKQFVHLYPESPERKRVDARIAELEKKVAQDSKKAPGQ